MKKSIALIMLLTLTPPQPALANNTNPVIELVGNSNNSKIQFQNPNQNRIIAKILTDQSADPNSDVPTLKVTLDNVDVSSDKSVVDCSLRTLGANKFEYAGVGKALYTFACDFAFGDKVQFDSNKVKFRLTATHLSKVSFVDHEIELTGIAVSPTYKVDLIQFTSDGKFRFQATTRLMNLKVPASDVKFQICIDDFGCENTTTSSSGLVNYSRVITKANYTWLRVRISATANNGSLALNPLTETIYREKSPTPSPTSTPVTSGSSGSSYGGEDSEPQAKPEPKTKLRSFVKVPVSAKLGVPFPVTVSVKGSGAASCYFAVYFSTNGWTSYNTNGGTASKRFQVRGGRSVTINGVMAVNYKGPWGVIVYCTDTKTKASLPIVVGRLIQN